MHAQAFGADPPLARRKATAKVTESTRKLRAPVRVVLAEASVFHQHPSRHSCQKGNGHFQKSAFATTSPPRAHRSIARRLRAAASASASSIPVSPTTRTATTQATEPTRKLRELVRVVLVQASVFRRLPLSKRCTFPASLTPEL